MAMEKMYGNAISETQTDPRETTAIEQAKLVLESAIELSNRVQTAVNRIAGSVPTSDNPKSPLSGVSNGVLDDLRGMAEKTSAAIRDGIEAVARLDRVI